MDCNWVTARRPVVGLWGIYDPGGVYVVAHEEYPSQVKHELSLTGNFAHPPADVVGANVQHAYEAGCRLAKQGMEQAQKKAPDNEAAVDSPQFVLIFPSWGYEHSAVKGIGSVLGTGVPVLGGTSCIDFASGKGLQLSNNMTTTTGVSAALCWPSVHAVAAFCSGYMPTANQGGTITKVDHCYRILEIDGKPAKDVILEWSGLRAKWDKALSSMVPDMELGKENTMNGFIGVEVARDSDGEPLYKVVPVINYERDTTAALTPQAVEEGQRIVNMRCDVQNLQDRASKVSRQLLRASGFSVEEVRGAIAIICGSISFFGNDVLEQCGEKVSDAVGNMPLLGLCSLGEQGQFGDGTSSSGGCMCSTIAFTNKKVTAS